MKKRVLSLLLMLILLIGAMPMTALAADKLVKSLDVTIEAPEAGMTKQEGTQLALLSAKGDGNDLFSKGALAIQSLSWMGEFDETDRSNPRFKAGMTYVATIRLRFVSGKGYLANYDTTTMTTDSSKLKVTVNGTAATVFVSSAGVPTVQVNIKVPAAVQSEAEQQAAAVVRNEKFDLRHASLRDSEEPYSVKEADALWVGEQEMDVVVLDQGGYTFNEQFDDYTLQERIYVTKAIVDYAEKTPGEQRSVSMYMGTNLSNLRELWVGDKADVVEVIQGLTEGVCRKPQGGMWYWTNSTGFGTADATVYIPASKLETVKAAFGGAIQMPFTVKVYDGDVYTAQKAGDSAAREWCTKHSYTAQIMAADRICHYESCTQDRQWYWSCVYCGKCEYNDKHTFNRDYSTDTPIGKLTHIYYSRLATEEAYAGVNAAGDHVFWLSCLNCGHSYNYHQENPTKEDWKESGVELTYEQYKEFCKSNMANQENWALIETETSPYMFTLSAKATAKMSRWAQSAVNHAMDNNLLDTALLGNDYTKPITRLQFCSVAVRLAEELTGKTIQPAPATTFSDTTNTYVLKAYAAGISSGTSATTFSPTRTLDRQQMATFLYNTIQYVKKNSDIGYSECESRLESYADASQVSGWARTPFAFMNALGLINGTSDTALSPRKQCTIEQALAVASSSIYAHQVGWYQVVGVEEKTGLDYLGMGNNGYWYIPSYSGMIPKTLAYSDRIWVTANRVGNGVNDMMLDENKGEYDYAQSYLPTVDPYSGQTFYVKAEWLRPVRD